MLGFRWNKQKSLLNIRAEKITKTGTYRFISNWYTKEQVKELIKTLKRKLEVMK